MMAAIGLYVFKILALAVVMSQLIGTTAFNTKLFGFTAIVCVLAWCAAQVFASIKFKTLYVEPDGER